MARFSGLLVSVSLLALAACGDVGESTVTGPVDPRTLGPLPARELLAVESGNSSLREGSPAQAERSYRKAMALSKGHVDAHILLARLLTQQGRTEEAQQVIQAGLKLQPEQSDLNLMLGKHLLNKSHFPEAQRVFENGLIQSPRNVDLLTGKAVALDMQGDHIAAQVAYREALTFNTGEDTGFVKNNLGLSYLFANKAKEAVALLEPLAASSRASGVTKHNLALAYSLLGEEEKAAELLGATYEPVAQKELVEGLKRYYEARSKGEETALPPTLPVQKSQ